MTSCQFEPGHWSPVTQFGGYTPAALDFSVACFAAELAKENVPLNLIQKQLGHSSVATTSQYLDHIAPQQVIEAMRSRQWRGDPN